jgi:hypothetical protein
LIVASVLAGPLAAASGCASARDDAPVPAWFAARMETQKDEGGYPSLQDVPTVSTATTDPAHWAAVAADVEAGAAEMRANPRNEPLSADDAAQFEQRAREAIEATRAAH